MLFSRHDEYPEQHEKASGDVSDSLFAYEGREEVSDEYAETGGEDHRHRRTGKDDPGRAVPAGQAENSQLGFVTQLGEEHDAERSKEYLPHVSLSFL